MAVALWLVGAPGAGKTTLARELMLEEMTSQFVYYIPQPKWTVGAKFCAAGHYTGEMFDGADTVPYNGVNDALHYWQGQLAHLPMTLFDGDRFSYQKVVDWYRAQGVTCAVALLQADDTLLAQRRAIRGSNQNPTWMKGRATKAMRFFELFSSPSRLTLDAALSPKAQATLVRLFLERLETSHAAAA